MRKGSKPLQGDWSIVEKELLARKGLEHWRKEATSSKGTRAFEKKEQTARKELKNLRTSSKPHAPPERVKSV